MIKTMLKISFGAIVRVPKRKRFEIHTFGHLHLPYFLIDYASRFHFYFDVLFAVEAVLAAAGESALYSSSKAGAVFFVAFSFFAGTEDFVFLLRPYS